MNNIVKNNVYENKKTYSKPIVLNIGNVVDLTFGGKAGWGSDTYSTRFTSRN